MIIEVIRRERTHQGFMQRAKQRGRGERRILLRQMSGTHRSYNAHFNLASDFATARQPGRGHIHIDRFSQNAPGQLLWETMCTATMAMAAASAEDGPGAASAAPRIAVSSSCAISAISSEIRSAFDGK